MRPCYDLGDVRVGIVHLGIGNFHRAHQAVFVDDALAAGERDWAICAINLRRREPVDRLRAQDGLYTLLVRGGGARVIGSLRESIAWSVDAQRASARLADPAVRIVTLTVTEKAYVVGADGAMELLADGLARRLDAGAGPLTLLSCDNLSMNGDTLRQVLREAIRRRGDPNGHSHGDCGADHLLGWFDENVECPNAVVDRIVPATVPADLRHASALIGLRDDCAVATEPFTQWIVEDRFAAGRPDWARDGVQFVRDVAPFEAMKLRLLNAAHSALACLGVPAGIETVDQAIAEPALRAFVERMWRDDLVPGLPVEARDASVAYRAALLERFANPALGHRLIQIATDSSQKIRMRWLPPIAQVLAAGRMPDSLALALAAWIRFLGARGERGQAWTIDDPLADVLVQRLARASDHRDIRDARVDAILGFEPLFGELAGHAGLRERVRFWHRRLVAGGTQGALR